MAAVAGDYGADHSRFHAVGSSMRHHEHESSYHDSEPRSRPRDIPHQQAPRSPDSPSQRSAEVPSITVPAKARSPSEAASRLPSPPDSSTSQPALTHELAQNVDGEDTANPMSTTTQTATSAASTLGASNRQASAPPANEPAPQGQTIVIRNLAHIESLARADVLSSGNRLGGLPDTPLQAMKYEISSMPIGDVIEMVAALLTKITTTNDLQHDALHRNATHQQTAASHNNDGASMSPLSSSVLAFHGKNVPAITIMSYLSRIHKYCPTTYEVFLSLLVYFDRMTESVNHMVMQAEESRRQSQTQPARTASTSAPQSDAEMRDSEDDETDSDLADDETEPRTAIRRRAEAQPAPSPTPNSSPATYFVVDSFNIHRLIIAGVTCASKFFSDVFYTNSRYAKVGGLPLAELNHLELQFLVLNDFRLSVPVEDLEAYATMLVEFYAREVVGSSPTEPTDTV
ncbi:PHO85 cyclin-6/7 [Microdochium nivale]|nr:PHO85 cyclin-6/7 [Microdochium nivale]